MVLFLERQLRPLCVAKISCNRGKGGFMFSAGMLLKARRMALQPFFLSHSVMLAFGRLWLLIGPSTKQVGPGCALREVPA